MVNWLAKVVEENLRYNGNVESYRTKREGDSFFLVQCWLYLLGTFWSGRSDDAKQRHVGSLLEGISKKDGKKDVFQYNHKAGGDNNDWHSEILHTVKEVEGTSKDYWLEWKSWDIIEEGG